MEYYQNKYPDNLSLKNEDGVPDHGDEDDHMISPGQYLNVVVQSHSEEQPICPGLNQSFEAIAFDTAGY